MKNRRGRPHLLTPLVEQKLIDAVHFGLSKDAAANYAGIGRGTLYRYLNDPRPRFRDFARRFDIA